MSNFASSDNKYTFYGVIAILLWSTVTGLIRDLSELFSPIAGAAMMYTVSALFLMSVMGIPKIKDYPKRYLFIGGGLFVTYEICLALSLGMANSRLQAMEMSIAWCIAGDQGISLSLLLSNISDNPITYSMAFSAAFIWAIYCVVTQKNQ